MKDKKVQNKIMKSNSSRYLLKVFTRFLVGILTFFLLIFIFFRWTGAITNTPFAWKRPTIKLVDQNDVKAIEQVDNQLWVNAKFKKHHAKVKKAELYIINKDNSKQEGDRQKLISGTNSYIFNNISSGKKEVMADIDWSLFGHKTYDLGTTSMDDVTSITLLDETLSSTSKGTSYSLNVGGDFITMQELKDNLDFFDEKYFNNLIDAFNNFVFVPWLGKTYDKLCLEDEAWKNMPVAFNFLINQEHDDEVQTLKSEYNKLGYKILGDKNLVNLFFNTFIPQPFILDDKTDTTDTPENLYISNGIHKYNFENVLLSDKKFYSLKDLSLTNTDFKILNLGIAKKPEDNKINESNSQHLYLAYNTKLIQLFALASPNVTKFEVDLPSYYGSSSSILITHFILKAHNYKFDGTENFHFEISQERDDWASTPKVYDILAKDLPDWHYYASKDAYMFENLKFDDALEDTSAFNFWKDPDDQTQGFLSRAKIHFDLTIDIHSDDLEDTHFEVNKKIEDRSSDLIMPQMNSSKKKPFVVPWLNLYIERRWIIPDISYVIDSVTFQFKWSQAIWQKIAYSQIHVPSDFIIDQLQFKLVTLNEALSPNSLNSPWFSMQDHNKSLYTKYIGSTTGSRDPKLETWSFDLVHNKSQLYNDDGSYFNDDDSTYEISDFFYRDSALTDQYEFKDADRKLYNFLILYDTTALRMRFKIKGTYKFNFLKSSIYKLNDDGYTYLDLFDDKTPYTSLELGKIRFNYTFHDS